MNDFLDMIMGGLIIPSMNSQFKDIGRYFIVHARVGPIYDAIVDG